MQNKVTPFLWFDGTMEEAIDFYVSVFKDARIVSSNPMSAEFELLGQRFMAMNYPTPHRFTEATSFFVSCKDQAEVDAYWNAFLAGGGSESMCGWLKDKYGVSWQIIPEALVRYLNDPNVAQRVGAAMMNMKKIIVADLEAAAAAG